MAEVNHIPQTYSHVISVTWYQYKQKCVPWTAASQRVSNFATTVKQLQTNKYTHTYSLITRIYCFYFKNKMFVYSFVNMDFGVVATPNSEYNCFQGSRSIDGNTTLLTRKAWDKRFSRPVTQPCVSSYWVIRYQ